MNLSSPTGVRLSARRLAFTLMELLVVMSIAVLVIGLALPAVNSVLGGKAVARGINDVTGIIETARAEAMARRAYVSVMFVNATNSDGNSELRVAASLSKRGLNNWGSDLQAISPVVKVPGVMSTVFDGKTKAGYGKLPDALQTYVKNTDASLASDSAYVAGPSSNFNKGQSPSFVVGGQKFDEAPYICFSPEGELIAGDPYNMMFKTYVAIALSPTRGTTLQSTAKDGAVVVVYGGSAKLRIIRP